MRICPLHRRDEQGKVVKDYDHLMDAMRYLVMSGLDRMSRQAKEPKRDRTRCGGCSEEAKCLSTRLEACGRGKKGANE